MCGICQTDDILRRVFPKNVSDNNAVDYFMLDLQMIVALKFIKQESLANANVKRATAVHV